MRKIFMIAVAAVFVLSIASMALADMTGDEIIAKHLEKTGGLDNYKNLKTMKMDGKAFIGQMAGTLTLARKAPDKYYMLWQADQFQVVVASDGEKVWQLIPMVPGYIFTDEEDLPKQLEGMLMNPYLDYKERGASVKLVGEEAVKGLDCYKVEYIMASGDTSYQYFDKTDFNLLRQQDSESDQIFDKYKDVDGFILPHKMTSQQGDQRIMMLATSYEVNGDIADSLFVAPPDSLAAPPEILEQLKQQQEAARKAAEEKSGE